MAYYPFDATTTPRLAVPYNPKRKSLSVYNLGSATVFASQNARDPATDGWPIVANSHITLLRQDGDNPEYRLYLEAASGTQNCRIQEGTGLE